MLFEEGSLLGVCSHKWVESLRIEGSRPPDLVAQAGDKLFTYAFTPAGRSALVSRFLEALAVLKLCWFESHL